MLPFMRYTILTLLLTGLVFSSSAQEKQKPFTQKKETFTAIKDSTPDYASYPYWITMMDDTAANYFTVCKAFYAFWEGKIKPVREDNEAHNIFSEGDREDKEEILPSEYTYEYKRFKFWERYYKDLHDENGIILSPERIIEEWRKRMESERREGSR